jgi:hypothetical protein
MIASTATSLLFVVISQVRCYQVKLSDSVTKIELVFDKSRLLSEQSRRKFSNFDSVEQKMSFPCALVILDIDATLTRP